MTKEQFLLLKLSEECAEVSQRCSKQIQFGKFNVQNGQELTNGERLKNELLDLTIMFELLQESCSVPNWNHYEYVEAKSAKIAKLQKYLDLSNQLGTLPEIKL
jgi:hypothetical protein